jgi:hypothetical protein
MKRSAITLATTALLLVCWAVTVMPAADGSAAGRRCRSVQAGGHKATHVFVDHMRCRTARGDLHKWLGRGHLPRNAHGWYCYPLGKPVWSCSYPGKKHPQRDFTFWLRNAS